MLSDFSEGWLYRSGYFKDARFPDYLDYGWQELADEEQDRLSTDSDETSEKPLSRADHAWYRKHFSLPDSLKERSIMLLLTEKAAPCKIYLNGHDLGRYVDQGKMIECDLSPYLRFGPKENNVLAVNLLPTEEKRPPADALLLHKSSSLRIQ